MILEGILVLEHSFVLICVEGVVVSVHTINLDTIILVILNCGGFHGVVFVWQPFKLLKESPILLQMLQVHFLVLGDNA